MKSNPRPLFGRRILVTRARAQASVLSGRLAALGAVPIEFPVIRIAPVADMRPLDEAIRRLVGYDWVIFTSVNGVTIFWERLALVRGQTSDALGVKTAAIGPATAAALVERGAPPAFVPDTYVAEAIAEGLGDVAGQSILLPRAVIARKALANILKARGAKVEEIGIYETLPGEPPAAALAELEKGADAVTFTSSSTVRNFMELLDGRAEALLVNTLVACIGPITARTAAEYGLRVGVVAEAYTTEGLVTALVRHFREIGDCQSQTRQ